MGIDRKRGGGRRAMERVHGREKKREGPAILFRARKRIFSSRLFFLPKIEEKGGAVEQQGT